MITTPVLTRKVFTLSMLLFAVFSVVSAQTPIIQFQKTIGGSNNDILSDLQPTTDGGSIAVGYTMSGISGDKTEALATSTLTNNTDVWVVKLDATGVIQWHKTLGGDRSDVGAAGTQTIDGGYIIGATSQSNISGDKMENSFGSSDFWIIKLDAFGAIQWQKTIGGDKLEKAKDIQITTDGGFIVGGYSNSNISGNKTDNSLGFDDYWVVKLDDLGAIQWQKSIGSDGYDNLNELKQTADGGYILGGFTYEGLYPNANFPRYGAHDFYAVKLNAVGTVQWQKVYGGSSDDYIESLQQTTDGGYILGGYSTSPLSGNKTESSNGGSNGDYWLVKIDALGTIQWQNDIGGSSLDNLLSVQQTQDGGYILGGYSFSPISGDKTENSFGNGDFWVVKTNNTGSIQWQKTIGGSANEVLVSLKQLADGSYLMGGYSASNISGNKTENGRGGNDFWAINLSDPGATNTPSVSDVYYCPNQAAVPLAAVGQDLLWYTTATGGAGSTVAPTPSTTTVGFMTYYVSQTVNTVESPRVAISVVVKTPPSVTISGLGTMCAGTSQSIMAYAGTAFVWSDGVTTSQRVIAPTTTTTYTVTITSANGCTNSGSRIFYVSAPPVASITGSTSICNGTSTVLTASAGSSGLYYGYRWNTGQTTAAITVAPNSTKTYSVTVTMGSCTSAAAKTVTVTGVAPSTMSMVGINTSYPQNAAAFTLVGSPTGGTFRIDNVTKTSFNPSQLTVGNHIVTYTITQGMCNSVITKTVAILAPIVNLQGNNIQLAFNSSVEKNRIKLEWFNNTGYKNDYFIVQKMNDAGVFINLEYVKPEANTKNQELNFFKTYDVKPINGENIYRIHTVFNDGNTLDSEIKTVNFKEVGFAQISPNPANDFININLENYIGKPVELSLINQFGQLVKSQIIEEVQTPVFNMDISTAQSGLYMMNISSKGKRDAVVKFVVNK